MGMAAHLFVLLSWGINVSIGQVYVQQYVGMDLFGKVKLVMTITRLLLMDVPLYVKLRLDGTVLLIQNHVSLFVVTD